jgi:hypothetical protein
MNSFKEMENGTVFVIMPERIVTVPLFCPLCEMPMQTQDDSLSFKEIGCCYYCDLEYRSQILENRLVEDNQLKPTITTQDTSIPERLISSFRNSDKWVDYRKARVSRSKRTIILK